MNLTCYRCNCWPCECKDGQTIIHGDCREVLPLLPKVDAVISDPPYGISHNTDYSGFSGGRSKSRCYSPIAGDNREFDPTPWLQFPLVVLFGFHCFSNRLPAGGVLIWLKKRDSQLGTFMGDCELAWMNKGHSVRLKRIVWVGHDRETERGQHYHPTQKPVQIMEWCIESIGATGVILDPFLGSGTTLVACKNLGHKGIGIEIEEKYCEIAANRLRQEVLDFKPEPAEALA